jgi:carboxyl-terminal processing protease
VYGGGGIIPDVFVAVDTTSYIENEYFSKINSFTFEYADDNRNELLEQGFEDYDLNTEQQKNILEVVLSETNLERNVSAEKKALLSHYLKALIARQIFDETSFSKINDRRDPMLLKVIELDSIQ